MKNKYKLVYIEWEDAHQKEGWLSEEQLDYWVKNTDFFIKMAGFLLKETDKYLLITPMIGPKDKDDDSDSYGDVHKIPKGWIRKRKTLKI